MYVNLWLWNSACYSDFEEAVKDGGASLACRYIEKDSKEYNVFYKGIEGAREALDDDYLKVEEVPFVSDKNG